MDHKTDRQRQTGPKILSFSLMRQVVMMHMSEGFDPFFYLLICKSHIQAILSFSTHLGSPLMLWAMHKKVVI